MEGIPKSPLHIEREWVNSAVHVDEGTPARNQALSHRLPEDDFNNAWMKSAQPLSSEIKDNPLAIAKSRIGFALTSKLRQVFAFLAVREMNKPAPQPSHHQEDQPLAPAIDVEPLIDFKNVELSQTIARDEICKDEPKVFGANRVVDKVMAVKSAHIKQMSANLDENIRRAMSKALFSGVEGIVFPQTPEAIANMRDDVVAASALSGPFAGYIERADGTNAYRIDLSNMSAYPVRMGQAPLGFIAEMHYDEATEQMVVDWIDLPAESTRVVAADVYSDDPAVRARTGKAWERAQRIAMASMMTHMIAIRHLLGCHLKVGEVFSALTNTHLSETNPVAHLLKKFLFRVQATNHYRIPSLISDETSALPTVFSYPRTVLREFVDDAALAFDLGRMDPRVDAKHRNMTDPNIKYPHLENVVEIWKIMEAHVSEYVKAHYKDDAAVAGDPELASWFEAVGAKVGGAHAYSGPLGIEALVKLITVVMYSEAIEHEHVGRMVANYVLLPEIPSSVRMNGDLPSQAEFQTLVGLVLLTSLPAASGKPFNRDEIAAVQPFYELLSDDYPGMGAEGLEIMRKMRDKLAELDDRIRAEHTTIPPDLVMPTKCEPSAAA